jgi:SAM-dependent methyltransferase
MTLPPSTYDEIPYTSYPYPRTHPDRACAVGRLFGMDPAPITRCRVLELGCASGGNLLPSAELLPDSELVGVDLSARQVEQGSAAIAALGLRNVRLVHGDIAQIDDSWGSFDYIVCHGVYSWVPQPIQERILGLCRERLRPHGIACISYNTYPGWHMRAMVRDMMCWHTRQIDDKSRRVRQARALVDFLARNVNDQEGAYAKLLRRELDLLGRVGDDYLFHEHLEEHNAPVYFHEFVDRLDAHDLRYLGEADVHTMLATELSSDFGEALARIAPDLIAMEQYMDFVRNRQFRTSLVVHGEVELRRELGPEQAVAMRWWLKPADDAAPVDMTPEAPHSFRTSVGTEVTTSRQVTKAAMVILRERWPRSYGFDDLYATASALCGVRSPREDLAADLLQIWLGGGVEGSTWEPPLAAAPGARPRATGFARWQAPGGFVANTRHQRVDLDTVASVLVPLCDGTRTHEQLLDRLCALADDGTIVVQRDEESIGTPSDRREMLAEVLGATLTQLARAAVLLEDGGP